MQRLAATTVQCPSLGTEGAVDGALTQVVTPDGETSSVRVPTRLLASEIGVALNGAYVQDESTDYVGIRNLCPEGTVNNFQGFLQFRQRVDSIYPTGGPVQGGTTVTVRGSQFPDHDLICLFGDVSVPATSVSDTEASCTAPAGLVAGATSLRLTTSSMASHDVASNVPALSFESLATTRARSVRLESVSLFLSRAGNNGNREDCRSGGVKTRRRRSLREGLTPR